MASMRRRMEGNPENDSYEEGRTVKSIQKDVQKLNGLNVCAIAGVAINRKSFYRLRNLKRRFKKRS
ncbi:hypothetical protein NC653_018344 [Populus alba x Populus x berolinensis]|uniref:Uncharacterized protein n=1 Tax=Populus alba x Populus x berolinensis TaxID=444605 RepID=A0AAD6VUZ8_9ROSI|nr:hypothetical protein NC653_018344 [Populus alba x Populus x berolinensis]